jgi:hypothetical protein
VLASIFIPGAGVILGLDALATAAEDHNEAGMWKAALSLYGGSGGTYADAVKAVSTAYSGYEAINNDDIVGLANAIYSGYNQYTKATSPTTSKPATTKPGS